MRWISVVDNLRLRNFREDDFEAFYALVSDYEVVQMLGSWPYPADPEFTRERMFSERASAVSAIECDGQLVGSIGGVDGGIGYLVNPSFWGRGIASWAVGQKVREMFRGNTQDNITTYVWNDNPASAVVLRKHGFVETRPLKNTCKARGGEVESTEYVLTRAGWTSKQPLHIETDRLIIRPFELTDGAELAALMNDRDIARMMATIPHPFSIEQATQWIADRPFDRSTGFGAKITLKDGTLIGFLGLGGDPVNTAYALGRKYWGKGYATEAMRAFLEDSIAVHALEEVTAGAFIDNSASQKVLEKLGFERVGKKMYKASGRLEEAPLFLYRLRSAKFGIS